MTPSALLNLWPSLRTVLDQPARRRNGKIARLPEPDRIAINQMLDQGLPYHTILERLGDAGRHLNPQNLSNWKHLGGYQSWRTRKLSPDLQHRPPPRNRSIPHLPHSISHLPPLSTSFHLVPHNPCPTNLESP